MKLGSWRCLPPVPRVVSGWISPQRTSTPPLTTMSLRSPCGCVGDKIPSLEVLLRGAAGVPSVKIMAGALPPLRSVCWVVHGVEVGTSATMPSATRCSALALERVALVGVNQHTFAFVDATSGMTTCGALMGPGSLGLRGERGAGTSASRIPVVSQTLLPPPAPGEAQLNAAPQKRSQPMLRG